MTTSGPGQLQQEIERTRGELGETVQQLTAKADVKSRARDKAAELSGRVKDRSGRVGHQAAARAGSVRDLLAGKTAAARQKMLPAGGAGKDGLQSRGVAVAAPMRQATPEQIRQAVAKRASTARQRRVQIAMAAGALGLVLGYLAIRQGKRRTRSSQWSRSLLTAAPLRGRAN